MHHFSVIVLFIQRDDVWSSFKERDIVALSPGEGTLTRCPGSYSRPLANRGTVTAALRLIERRGIVSRDEWTGVGRQIVLSP